ncbi:MAG: LytR C-terminal domain-containing protein [Marmoricola sp.]
MGPHARHEQGMVLPAAALMASICAVAVAAVGFVLTSHPDAPAARPTSAVVQHPVQPPAPRTTAPAPVLKPKHARQRVDRAGTYVVVFNNSNIKGLAGQTSARARNAGWNVVGSDNWYGTIDSSTVYYPARLHAAAKALAHDLHIGRLRPAIAPMQFDRLTVILTADYAG